MENKYFTLDGQISVGFLKKRNFTGSYKGMRYNLFVKDGQIVAATYPQPYCWECTPEDKKTAQSFELSQEGLDAAIAWLNESWGEHSWQA